MTCLPFRGPPGCHTNSCWALLRARPTVSSQHLCMEGSDRSRFTDEKTEVQGDAMTCPGTRPVATVGLYPRISNSQPFRPGQSTVSMAHLLPGKGAQRVSGRDSVKHNRNKEMGVGEVWAA